MNNVSVYFFSSLVFIHRKSNYLPQTLALGLRHCQIIVPLAVDKSRYFAQSRPIIPNSLMGSFWNDTSVF